MRARFSVALLARAVAIWIALAAGLSIAAAQQPKQHQATGTIATIGAGKLTLSKQFGRNKAQWNFAVPLKAVVPIGISRGARVTIYYHEEKSVRIADRIKLLGGRKEPKLAPAPKQEADSPQ